MDFLRQAWRTLVPEKGADFGPLPPLLVGLTVVTGLVDAVSYLALGRVFVANMTGNVVVLGFAIAGAKGFSIPASLSALVFFALGSSVGGLMNSRIGTHRGRLLGVATSVNATLMVVAIVAAAVSGATVDTGGAARFVLIGLLAVAMGVQNAVVRKLAVPDLTTTVLTLTTTGIFADAKFLGGPGSKAGRRGISVLAMFLGALIGALLVLHASVWVALLPAAAVLVVETVVIRLAGWSDPPWSRVP